MGLFVLRRVFSAAALLVLVPSLTFVFFTVSRTGGPILGPLGDYLSKTFVHFDLGKAVVRGHPDIKHLLSVGIPADVSLLVGGFGLGVLAGVAAGAYVAGHAGSRRARLLEGLGAIALSAPVQTTGFVLVVYLGSTGGDHPLFFVSDSGVYRPLSEDPLGWLHALWVPWLSVALPVGGAMMRLAASATREALESDPVRTARAKGVADEQVLRRHALPFAVPPLSALGGASMNLLLLNIALMEQLFNIPGSFRYARQAIDTGDLALLQAMTLVGVLYIVAGNLVSDLVLARFDPRTARA